MKIMIVDDDRDVRIALVQLFELHGHETYDYWNGEQALRSMDHVGALFFDRYVLDFQMPMMCGDELARKIKQINPAAMIVIVSGDSSNAEWAKTVGVEFMVKGLLTWDDFARVLHLAH